MNRLFPLAAVCCLALTLPTAIQAETVYEMRIYTAHEGKLNDLLTRFRDHTCKLFEKHGMTNIGYFTPTDEGNDRLIYFLSYPSRDAREASWKAFLNDPDWKAAFAKSHENGPLVQKVEASFLVTTDYSPALNLRKSHEGDARLYELRTYTATPGNLSNLDARFRDHTIKLFAKHGMENVVYFHLMPDQKGAEDTLIYLISHRDAESSKAGFKAFGQDPEWQAARKASEENAGGPLTVKGGVQSQLMMPTNFSALQ
ncbi:MAG: NIPSNAP family protein [Planctomycetaceae bacterium]|nr:NIPSNAP family protein [Planctomycetaceae bacterium]